MSEQEDPGFRLGWKVVSFPFTKLENAREGGGLGRKYGPCELEAFIGRLCGDFQQIWNKSC